MNKNLGKYILPVLLFFLGGRVTAQDNNYEIDPILVNLKAKIINIGDGMPVPYANVLNNRTHGGTISNSAGMFSMEMLNIDSLIISAVGFMRQTIRLPRTYLYDTVFVIRMKPVNYQIGEVTVTGDKNKVNLDGVPSGKPVNIDPKLRGDAFNKRPPVIAAFFNPISYWQYYLSRKEIQKRKAREAMALEKNWEMHSKNYNKQMVTMLTGMTEAQVEDFMIWFNGQDVLPYTATEYEVRAAIREYFQIYRREKGIN